MATITFENVKNFFPFNKVEAFHIDLGYAIPFNHVYDLPDLIQNSEITHFATFDNNVVVVYCRG